VEEQDKMFKVHANILAEKAANQADKQAAEFTTELILGKDTMFYGKLSKGLLEGRVNHNFNKQFSVSSNFHNSTRVSQVAIEKAMMGKDFTVTLGYDLVRRDQTDQSVNISYLQSVSPNFSMGCKCMHTLNEMTDLQFMGQYKKLKGKNNDKEGNIITFVACPNYQDNRGVLSLGYTKMLKPGLSLVTELTATQLPPGNQTGKPYASQCVAGARYVSNTFQYHCVVDSSGTIAAHLRQVTQFGPQLILSGLMNHVSHQSQFGVGLQFSPNRQ